MRLLFLNWRDTSHPLGGGSERYVEQLAAGVAALGHDVTIQCAAHGNAPTTELRDGVRFRRKGGRFSVYPHGFLAVLRERPDVVIDVQNHIPFFSRLIHRHVIVVVHHVSRDQWQAWFGPWLGRLGWWIESRLAPRLYRRARYVTVSGPTRDDVALLGVDPCRVTVVHNVTDPAPARVTATKTTEPTLCVIARLVPHKRVDHAIDVLARLAGEFPDVRLRIVGDGPLKDGLERYSSNHRVEFLGHLDEQSKHDVVASSWVLLCPSAKEGWGRVVMEAAVHGVPCVAYSDSGGLTESIRHGQTGLLADDLDELVEHTRWLLKDAELREELGRAAAQFAGSFTLDRSLSAFGQALGMARADKA